MPICKNCSDNFKNYAKINGVLHNISRRKFCLKCSPFGKHNTRSYIDPFLTKEKICIECNKKFTYDRSKGCRGLRCNSCYLRKRYNELKEKAIAYKGGQCIKCGYNKCINALDFHHVNGNKSFTIGGAYSRSWSALQLELDKCDLLCCRCHREEHAEKNLGP